ncbi:hypothetical protein J2T55_002315 [Methylohalomonas lacus]|uniref:Uncharacterized protein n=1 Tax=Methylohalomonas lacus TaxID=398773 RepID=A0AAE3HL69_9GAMM|nr:hypothetical protein [Methylohalomonas lacus]
MFWKLPQARKTTPKKSTYRPDSGLLVKSVNTHSALKASAKKRKRMQQSRDHPQMELFI